MRRFLAAFTCLAFLVSFSPPAKAQAENATFLANLRSHIKHVFVIYQENRSFDSYFGTFPGADNLASPKAMLNGYRQYDPLGRQFVTPFRIADPDLADANHARPALETKMDGGAMDLYISTEEFGLLARGYSRGDAQRVGLLTMAHEDCDTIPFLWKYAHTFALFDHFFQATTGPSTPGNISIIAAQTGQTQWARDASEQISASDTGPGVPVLNDSPPAFGPFLTGAPDPLKRQIDLTFANVLLTLTGKNANKATVDTDEIKDDITSLVRSGHSSIGWGWYQEGFGAQRGHMFSPYVTHHNAVQYFGYERKNTYFWNNVHDLTALQPALQQGTLPDHSVTFIKGGYDNPFGLKPANKDRRVQAKFLGDDDHPGYSDSQISESMVATMVNAIAHSRYWKDSAILIAWDDSEGYYDHVSPPQFERCPDNHACGDGPRVPAILISPYAKTGAIIRAQSDHTSFVKFLDTLFNLPPLATLPDEAPYMPEGPRDTESTLSDLTDAFDPARLAGTKAPIPASAAEIPAEVVRMIPSPWNCKSVGITPISIPGENVLPAGFSPRTHEH